VQFRLRLLPDGYVEKVDLLGETGRGPYAAVARQRAAAAIKKCEPYDFLPPEDYNGWKESSEMTSIFRVLAVVLTVLLSSYAIPAYAQLSIDITKGNIGRILSARVFFARLTPIALLKNKRTLTTRRPMRTGA